MGQSAVWWLLQKGLTSKSVWENAVWFDRRVRGPNDWVPLVLGIILKIYYLTFKFHLSNTCEPLIVKTETQVKQNDGLQDSIDKVEIKKKIYKIEQNHRKILHNCLC